MVSYVVGFAHDKHNILLIRKNRPDWQKGKLNGVGGKIEKGELPTAAMIREFREETGVYTLYSNWRLVCLLQFEQAQVHVFEWETSSQVLTMARTMTDEQLELVSVPEYVDRHDLIDNLHFLIPMMLYDRKVGAPFLDYRDTDSIRYK